MGSFVARIDDQIDELYRGPIEGFTRGRDELVKTAGSQHASRIRRLRKPTRVAWAANQLYWRDRRVYDRLMSAGQQLRKAQLAALAKRTADPRGAADAHRRALADAVHAAEQIAARDGHAVDRDALSRTLDALSISETTPEAPGRLTHPLAPAGFEALTPARARPSRPRRRS
jgi:hypothetical protein